MNKDRFLAYGLISLNLFCVLIMVAGLIGYWGQIGWMIAYSVCGAFNLVVAIRLFRTYKKYVRRNGRCMV